MRKRANWHPNFIKIESEPLFHAKTQIKRELLEDRVLSGLKERLLHPGLIAAFIDEYHREFNLSRQTDAERRQTLEADLAATTRAFTKIVDAIADGMHQPSMKEKMTGPETRKQSIEAEIAALPQETPLETARLEATEMLRGLITAIRITPTDSDELAVELVGELAGIMVLGEADAKKPRHFRDGAVLSLVAGTGFEPVTFRL